MQHNLQCPAQCPAEEWQEEGQAWAVHYDLSLTVLFKDANRLQGPASMLCKWGAMKRTKKVVHNPGLQAQDPMATSWLLAASTNVLAQIQQGPMW